MQVNLYKTETCPYCKMESDWLRVHNIDFKEVFVDKDPVAAEDLVHKSGQMGIPLTEIIEDDGRTIYVLGFDEAKLALFLKIPE
jgi:glutaredoxin 3